jgi:hypothetical protein
MAHSDGAANRRYHCTMPFAYYSRLTRDQQRTYRESDRRTELALPPGVAPAAAVLELKAALERDERSAVQGHCQAITDLLTAGYQVPPVRILVMAQRPSDDYGELHGLYDPREKAPPATITLWMRTAALGRVVAFRSFLRTLVHELGHHLDYELFRFDETFHTEGFYKRESSLANALFAAAGIPPSAKKRL